MKKLKTIKENQGITLIALSITIIILLILSGITISALTGGNGLIQNARKCQRAGRNQQ